MAMQKATKVLKAVINPPPPPPPRKKKEEYQNFWSGFWPQLYKYFKKSYMQKQFDKFFTSSRISENIFQDHHKTTGFDFM